MAMRPEVSCSGIVRPTPGSVDAATKYTSGGAGGAPGAARVVRTHTVLPGHRATSWARAQRGARRGWWPKSGTI
ncbi:hypothetical protein Emag_007744 [Eimeria magna]